MTPSSNKFLSYRRKIKNRPSYLIGFLGKDFYAKCKTSLFFYFQFYGISFMYFMHAFG